MAMMLRKVGWVNTLVNARNGAEPANERQPASSCHANDRIRMLIRPMKISSSLKFIAGILISCLTTVGNAQEVDSLWRLRVMDMDNQLKVEATIRFTNETADSCMGGTWKRIVVEAMTAQEEDFFPLTEQLAYQLEPNALTLGRTRVCDGYLFLTGRPDGPIIQGTYDSVGWGRKKLGAFSLQKVQ